MSYVVETAPGATKPLERADSHVRASFLQIVQLLEEDPFPADSFPYIQRWDSPSGYTIFLYYDGVFPFVVEYRVFPLDSTRGGAVRVLRLLHRDDVPPELITTS